MDKISASQNSELEVLSRDIFRSILGDTRGGIHALLRAKEGLNPMEAVEEMMKIFFIKYYDEILSEQANVQNNKESVFPLIVDSKTKPEEFLSKVHQRFEEAKAWEARLLDRNLKYTHSHKIFGEDVQVRLSATTILQVFERLQAFSLHHSPAALKGAIFEDFLGKTFRDDLGQYFTPSEVIELMIRMVSPTELDIIGDPCCGPGRFLTHTLSYLVTNNHFSSQNTYEKFRDYGLYGADTSGIILQVARINCLLNEAPNIDLLKIDSLDSIPSECKLENNNVGLSAEGCSIILTNPPFGVIIDDVTKLKSYSIHQNKKGRIESQVLFIEKCLYFLRPFGILCMVIPESILDNKSNAKIREWIYEHAQIIAVISLPIETFRPYGTGIKTAIIILRKLSESSKGSPNREKNAVFMGTIQHIGYDNTGHPVHSDDVEQILQAYEQFKQGTNLEAKFHQWYSIPETQLQCSRFDVKFHEPYPFDYTRFQKFCPFTDYVILIDNKGNPSRLFESNPTKEIPYISIDELENDPFLIDHPRTIPAEDVGPSKSCSGGDIIVARLGPSLMNRKSLLLNPQFGTCFISTEFLVFRARPKIDPKFILWLTKSQMFIDQGLAKSSGATPSRYRLHDEFISKIYVPVYSQSEQKKIGENYWVGRQLIEQRIREVKATRDQINPRF